jgi:carboxypeptidase PM20D1
MAYISKEYDPTPGRAAEVLARAIGCRTVSYPDPDDFDYPEFKRFLGIIKESFPLFNKICESEIINEYSIVYCLKGRNSELKPLLLLGHYDVVPIEEGTEKDWDHDPFSGEIVQDYLWGRGTLDMKSQIIAHLEGTERLLEQGWQPERDIWFSYNFDEEQGGSRGADSAVAYFEKKGLSFDMVFDEGGAIVQGAMPGVKPPLAIIGLGEKGMADFKITVQGTGGHSSTPPPSTAIGKLSKIITHIEASPMPARLTSPVKAMLSVVGPEMPLMTRMALANMYIFKPLVMKIFSKNNTTNAMIRTSLSATMIRSGDAHNVLPQQAEANINCRLLPGDSGEDVLNHLRKIALKSCSAKDFTVEIIQIREASAISPMGQRGLKRSAGL